jgi:hypothetical protein
MNEFMTFDEALADRDFHSFYTFITELLELTGREDFLRTILSAGASKDANQFMDYQNQEIRINKSMQNDRVFPLDTATVTSFREDYDENLSDTVLLHYGPSADEYVRSFNALAIAIGSDIFFRRGAYRPENEDGRALLVHELTHVAQNNAKNKTSERDEEFLEREALQAEEQAKYNDDPVVTILVNKHPFRLKKSEMKEYAQHAANTLQSYIENEKYRMPEEKYLKLLLAYKEWLEERV